MPFVLTYSFVFIAFVILALYKFLQGLLPQGLPSLTTSQFSYGNQSVSIRLLTKTEPKKPVNPNMSSARLPERSKLGLEDPRVFKCFDRGDKYFWDENRSSRSSNVSITRSTAQLNNIIEKIAETLDNAAQAYPAGSYRYFIPRSELSSVTDINTVHSVLRSLLCCNVFSPTDISTLAHEICFGSGTRCHRPCSKLLALLILSDCHEDLITLIDEGMDDHCLPLEMVTGSRPLRCRNPQHNHRVINDYSSKKRREFHQWSYAVKAPYFTKPKNQHVHYVLEHNDVLPILQAEDHTALGALRVTQPRAKAPKQAECVSTYGGFSHVQRVKFHPSHIQFGPENHLNGEKPFALKKLRSKNVDDFNKELASLLTFQGGDYKHLIQLLVTFEIKGAQGSDSSEFHLVFPWADGTLWDFWNLYQDPEQRSTRSLWMAEQCYELAIALQLVHNERDQNLRKLTDVDKNDYDLYGRHGDVKAENTLWFGSRDILVMTDFGLGRLHSKISVSNDTRSSEGTMTYRAPEIDTREGKITRACDIYSMGCMFLEFITWHLEGWKSVSDDLPNSRMGEDHHGFHTDTFFQIVETPGEPQIAITKPQVTRWISRLKQHPKCTQFHLDFLELVEERMLEPKAQKRIKSPDLTRRLGVLWKTCRTDSEYWKLPASPSKLPN
ncbi:kinase-like protein [Lindgomyces ingoldianus]|uniref:Kinase-like protein n=1 Tax=Lindgomyces ingoldianus TaxID=673940 RepID=A0ACB6QFC1_9PLEO|nr:kinase-like protein [Lindgomyces ingoldianus]KAF2465719.1 kinase-like protein [Lindgomyces ingoldianus]